MFLVNIVYRGEKVAYTVKKFGDHRERRSYAKTENAIELGNLLEIQKKSYKWFIDFGIKEVFDDIFQSFTGNLSLEFGDILLNHQDILLKVVRKDMQLMHHH